MQPINHITRMRQASTRAIAVIGELRNLIEEYQLNGFAPDGKRPLVDADFLGEESDIAAAEYHLAIAVYVEFLGGLSPESLAALYMLRKG